jgi:hypothetical protein
MTHERDIDTLLDNWLDDGPTQSPDRVMDTVVDRIARQGQRPRWRFITWRAIPVIVSRPLLAGTAAVLIVGLAAVTVLRPGESGTGGSDASPVPSPTVSAAASPSSSPSPIACEDNLPGCAGPLAAGSHSSSSFQPALTYQTTVGWTNVIDTSTIFKLDSTGGQPYILVWADARIPQQSASCDAVAKPGAGHTTADWMTFVTTHPGLKASAPVAVDFGGGIIGQSVDLEVAATWKTTCPTHTGPYVMVSVADGSEYGVPSDQRLHLTSVDVGGKTLVMEAYGPVDAAGFATTLQIVSPVIASMRFAGG